MSAILDRRYVLRLGLAGLTGLGLAVPRNSRAGAEEPADKKSATKFQIACMTLPYAAFPLERALTGLKDAGFRCIAWGTTHAEADGKRVPVMTGDAPPEKAQDLGKRCRDLGLEPVMMFGPSPESVAAFKH